MSQPFGCKCEERKKPPSDRNWIVTHRNHNHSAFNGYHYTYSDYSAIVCLSCGESGRSNAAYVDLLRDGTQAEVEAYYKRINPREPGQTTD